MGAAGADRPEDAGVPEAENGPLAVFVDETAVVAPYRVGDETPVPHTDLTAEEIERKSFGQEPSIVLAQTPSVTFFTDSGGTNGYSYFRLRGIDQTRVNMTLDGVPLNEPEDQGAYFSNYPGLLGFVSSLQIRRGAGTSANGVASFAGSILFETPGPARERSVEVGAGFGSFGSEQASAQLTTPLGSHGGLLVRAARLASDGYKHHSGNVSGSVFYSLRWARGRHLVKVSGFIGEQENELAWLGVPGERLREDRRANGNTPEETDRFRQQLVMVQHVAAVATRTTVTSCLYHNGLTGDYDLDLDNFLGLGPGSELYNYAFRSGLVGGFANLSHAVGSLTLHTGVHANRYERRHTGSERSAGRLYRNTGLKDEASAFAKAELGVGGWNLFADMQVREARFDYQGTAEIEPLEWRFVNPSVGASRRLAAHLVAYASVARTHREPTRNDLFGGWDDLPVGEDGAPLLLDLPAEQVTDFEAGLRAIGGSWRAALNAFVMRFEDEIALNGQFGPNGLLLHSNVDRSERAGIELEATVALGGGVQLIHASSFARHRLEEQGVRFEPVLSPERIVTQEVLVERGALTVSLRGRYQGPSWVDFANSVELPGFTVLDAGVVYRWGDLRLDLHALNLLDRDALVFGSVRTDGVPLYFVNPPRTVFASVTWTR